MESRPAEPRILIVDDEPADVDVLSECLGAAGYAVAVAEDGERALDLCRQHPPDAVLLDIVLSGIDGFETCRRLKADGRTRDVPVLFITVLTDMGDRLKSFLVGGVDYIVKPFHREEVLARLGAHLAVRTLQRALVREVEERRVAQAALARANEELEARVADRTADLAAAIARLRAEIEVREQTESQLRQAQKMEVVGRLTGGVAHDFNNVLTVILGSADLVRHALPEGSPLHQHVANIRGAAERAAALTGRLLAFSRRQALQISVVDVNAIVGSVIGMVRRLIGEDIELITRLDPLLHRVRIDPTQLEQVILNLALNARDAMPGGGQLTIETADAELDEAYAQQHAGVAAGLYAMLAVSDTGVGMDDLTRARVFEPFFTTKAPGAGTGLGLATVHAIVRDAGGHIWFYSEAGRGTTFKVYVPRVEDTAEVEKAQPAASGLRGGSETVLLVEDDDQIRDLMAHVLERAGYAVPAASAGERARELCDSHPGAIHLLLTDVVMPGGLSGPQLAAELSARRRDMRVLYVSGYTEAALVHRGAHDEPPSFLQKPFTPSRLQAKVREVLDG